MEDTRPMLDLKIRLLMTLRRNRLAREAWEQKNAEGPAETSSSMLPFVKSFGLRMRRQRSEAATRSA